MALRNAASTAARMTAGFWNEVARTIQAPPPTSEAANPAAPQPTPSVEDTTPPEGSVLVPVDTWTRVMEQLGNLHRAGQELAEARERAARAETQVEFLREQLAESRARARQPSRPGKPSRAAAPTEAASPSPAPAEGQTGTPRVRITRVRNRLGGWISAT